MAPAGVLSTFTRGRALCFRDTSTATVTTPLSLCRPPYCSVLERLRRPCAEEEASSLAVQPLAAG